jgi:hypothetical protein
MNPDVTPHGMSLDVRLDRRKKEEKRIQQTYNFSY